MPGPPPKIDPVRRNARAGLLRLPSEGRAGAPPAWPLSDQPTDDERVIWADLWATPQAVAWERLGWTRVVARYCRVVLAAEILDRDAMAEARQLEDRLGLTPKAMRLLLWEIVSDEVAAKRRAPKAARGRVKAVN
jgi:hypothetical protein